MANCVSGHHSVIPSSNDFISEVPECYDVILGTTLSPATSKSISPSPPEKRALGLIVIFFQHSGNRFFWAFGLAFFQHSRDNFGEPHRVLALGSHSSLLSACIGQWDWFFLEFSATNHVWRLFFSMARGFVTSPSPWRAYHSTAMGTTAKREGGVVLRAYP